MISRCRTSALAALALTLTCNPSADAARPDGAGGGKPGGGGTTPPPTPDIVYMSVGSNSLAGPAIRGVTLATDPAASSDASLFKANSQRYSGSIAWSPDGTRFAWIESGAIMAAAPGGKAAKIYPTDPLDPAVLEGALAWGLDCSGAGDSVIAFLANDPFSVRTLTIKDGQVKSDKTLLEFKMHCFDREGVLVCTTASARAFAFSPRGRLLAFHGHDDDLSPGIWAASMCSSDPPALMLDNSNIESTSWFAPVLSIDWSPSGKQLAMSVTVGPDPDYPWRDIKIAYLNYSNNGSNETVSLDGSLTTVNLDGVFGAASSEHSPRWGPDTGGPCQRIAFSQSAGASDGSDMNGRRLFLLDVPSSDSTANCTPGSPVELNARNPRAIDWK